MKELLATPYKILDAFLEVLSSGAEKEEITEFRVNIKPARKDTFFFYPRQIFQSRI